MWWRYELPTEVKTVTGVRRGAELFEINHLGHRVADVCRFSTTISFLSHHFSAAVESRTAVREKEKRKISPYIYKSYIDK
jgi:hypothetical protein